MQDLFLILRTGLPLGITYGLIAYAFTLTYKSCRAFNFAVGQVTVLAGLVYISLTTVVYGPIAALGAVVLCALGGVALYFGVVRRPDVRGAQPVTLLILLLGVSILIDRTVPQIWGFYALAAPPLAGGGFEVGGANVSYQQILGVGLGSAAVAAALLFERRTILGKAMIATGAAREAAIAIGVNDRLVQAMAWGIAFSLLAVAALVVTPLTSAGVVAAPRFSVLGISAAFIGGLGNGRGALVGGVLIGLGSALVSSYVSSDYSDAILFVVIVVFLMWRPAGLLGDVRDLKGPRA
jgi:branched-chain amino acid transport system permease protein